MLEDLHKFDTVTVKYQSLKFCSSVSLSASNCFAQLLLWGFFKMLCPTLFLALLSTTTLAAVLENRQATDLAQFTSAAEQLISQYIPSSVLPVLESKVSSAASVDNLTGEAKSLIYDALLAISVPAWFTSAVPSEYRSQIDALEEGISSLRVPTAGGIEVIVVTTTNSAGSIITTSETSTKGTATVTATTTSGVSSTTITSGVSSGYVFSLLLTLLH